VGVALKIQKKKKKKKKLIAAAQFTAEGWVQSPAQKSELNDPELP